MCTVGQGDYVAKEGPTGFMISVQWKDGAGTWNTLRVSERFCNERIVQWAGGTATALGNPLGDGPFNAALDLGITPPAPSTDIIPFKTCLFAFG